MTELQYKDLTRKAMIREYFHLQTKTINIIDTANELYEYIERVYVNDPDLQELLDKFDNVVDNTNI
jgi:hypothetical protein